MASGEYERRFDLFGSHVRLLVGPPTRPGLAPPEAAGVQIEAFLRLMHRRLTRFEPDSELSVLNADPAEACQVSSLLATAAAAGVWAAEETGGLVDPTLVPELEQAGYARSRAGVRGASLAEALAEAPGRRPARPRPDARWQQVDVDLQAWIVRRPPGVRLDTGGAGKGLAADLASARLAGYATHVVDAGGDLRIGGEHSTERMVEVEHPLSGEIAIEFPLARGAVATSGLATRIWRTDGGFAHHLLDPATGSPAWTGVIQATAIADTALRAESLAKAALLSGPGRGRELLSERGGIVILDDGTVEIAGSLPAPAEPQDDVERAAA
jgi:thiamine biosynthesis lipoprotein